MAKSVEIEVAGPVLIWARESAALPEDVVAKKLKVHVDRLRAWESGTEHPSLARLRKLAEVYRRPLTAFFLKAPPQESSVQQNFRRLPGSGTAALSSELTLKLRELLRARKIALEMASLNSQPVPTFSALLSSPTDPVRSGWTIRQWLSVSLREQKKPSDDYAAHQLWRDAIEQKGVLVFQVSKIDLDDMRGISVWFDRYPIVGLNSRDPIRARTFSMLHELVHLALGQADRCLSSDFGIAQSDPIEIFCNAVAAEILAPRADLEQELGSPNTLATGEIEDMAHRLANLYKISKEAMLRRFVDLKVISRAFYQQWKIANPWKVAPKRAGGPPVHRRVLAGLGTRYVSSVLEALHGDRISLRDASSFLGLKVQHFPKLEQALYIKQGGSF